MKLASIACLVLGSAAIAGSAIAHPGGHDTEERPPYQGYDCSRMSGSYDTPENEKVRITVYEGTVLVTPSKGDAAVGECIAPTVEGQNVSARAKFEFGTGFGKALEGAGCCVAQLKGTSLVFDRAKGVEWKRRASQ